MNPTDVDTLLSRRLLAQQLAGPGQHIVADIVRALGGVQAQDYGWAKWAIGLRGRAVTEARVQRAIAQGEIVRTWAWRGTLHFLVAGDVGWLTTLLAPRLIASNERRYRQLGLDDETFAASNDILARILAGGQRLSRPEIVQALEEAGISAEGQRAPYLLQRAALDGLICLGPNRRREATYVLLKEWISSPIRLHRDEALATLARRYFAGRGPATLRDFSWWSGLPAADARAALELAGTSLVQVTVDGEPSWAGHGFESSLDPPAHLLPPFDEYLLSYKNRTAMLDPAYARRINPGGGMLKPAILIDGRVAGTWKRSIRSDSIKVTIEPFHPLEGRAMAALDEAARRLGEFYELPVERIL